MNRLTGAQCNKHVSIHLCNPSRHVDCIFLRGRTDFALIQFPFASVNFHHWKHQVQESSWLSAVWVVRYPHQAAVLSYFHCPVSSSEVFHTQALKIKKYCNQLPFTLV